MAKNFRCLSRQIYQGHADFKFNSYIHSSSRSLRLFFLGVVFALAIIFQPAKAPGEVSRSCQILFISKNESRQISELVKLFKVHSERMEIFELRTQVHRRVVDTVQNTQKGHMTAQAKEQYFTTEIAAIANLSKVLSPKETVRLSDPKELVLAETIELLKLARGDLALWKSYLKMNRAEMDESDPFSTYTTKGYILQSLPSEKKKKLLRYLGNLYVKTKNRSVVQPIHVLLDPVRVRKNRLRNGGRDRDFFNEYLRLVKNTVFGDSPFGGYSADLILQIAEYARQHLIQNDRYAREYIFFGSLPNGFAHAKSDIDLFNTFQFSDPQLQTKIDDLLIGSPWSWKLEEGRTAAHEHFGAVSHIFVIAINREKVEVRFYPNYLRVDPMGRDLEAFEYIVLDI